MRGDVMRRDWIALILTLVTAVASVRAASVSIVRWKGGATAAYSIIMDDFADSFGDLAIIDSMLANRNLNVSFAAITSRISNWQVARDLVSKGHEIVSHSVNHTQTWSQADYPIEVDSSKAKIEREVPAQGKCLFFGFPYDDRPSEKIDYIRTREYIGTRGGWPDRANIYRFDPFTTNYITFGHDGAGTTGLNALVDEAIGQGGYALREAHTVGAPGYYPIDPPDFASHLNYCRARADAGELWVAPVTRAIKYMVERERFIPSVTNATATSFEIVFDTWSGVCNPSPLVDNDLYDVPLTLRVTLDGGMTAGSVTVRQGGSGVIFTTLDATTIQFDADPWGGAVTVSSQTRVVQRAAPPLRVSPRADPADDIVTLNGARVLLHGRAAGLGLVRAAPAVHRAVICLE